MKYNVGDKFVIEIGREYFFDPQKDSADTPLKLYVAKGFNTLIFDEKGLDKLDRLNDDYINEHYGMFQYTAYRRGMHAALGVKQKMCDWEFYNKGQKDGFEAGMNTAWDVAQKIVLNEADGGMSNEKLRDIFGFQSVYDVFKSYTASEALEKIRKYEEKRKEEQMKGDL